MENDTVQKRSLQLKYEKLPASLRLGHENTENTATGWGYKSSARAHLTFAKPDWRPNCCCATVLLIDGRSLHNTQVPQDFMQA